MALNGHHLTVRRYTHYGEDLPVELSPFLVEGQNTLKIAMPATRVNATYRGRSD
jgi:hypothetical protein